MRIAELGALNFGRGRRAGAALKALIAFAGSARDLSPSQNTYWVQMQNSPTAWSGTSVTINDAAPSADRFNLSLCEVLPAK